MPSLRIGITTPTGHVGSRALSHLLPTNPITVLTRDPARLSDDVRARATVIGGSLEDPSAMGQLIDNVDALLFVVPPTLTASDWRAWQRKLGEIAADAVSKRVVRVVMISSAGAQRPDMGPISGLGEVESLFAQATSNFVSLRAGYFMENFLTALPTIAGDGVVYGGFPPELAIPMVATRDVAGVAAHWLRGRIWSGQQAVGVQGPADLSQSAAAMIIGQGVGRPVRYVQVALEQLEATFRGFGATPDVARQYVQMVRAISMLGDAYVAEARTPATTTPTTLEEFAVSTLRPMMHPAPVPS